MYCVVDASVVAKLFFPEIHHPHAAKFFRYALKNRWQLIAPSLTDYEIGNICWKKVRRKEINSDEAIEILQNFRELFLSRIEITPLLEKIANLSFKTQSTFYDSAYLLLARELNTKFVTGDEAFFAKANKYFPENVVLLWEVNEL